MLGSDLIKAIVDKNIVDKEIIIIGSENEQNDLENDSAQIHTVELDSELSSGVITFHGAVE